MRFSKKLLRMVSIMVTVAMLFCVLPVVSADNASAAPVYKKLFKSVFDYDTLDGTFRVASTDAGNDMASGSNPGYSAAAPYKTSGTVTSASLVRAVVDPANSTGGNICALLPLIKAEGVASEVQLGAGRPNAGGDRMNATGPVVLSNKLYVGPDSTGLFAVGFGSAVYKNNMLTFVYDAEKKAYSWLLGTRYISSDRTPVNGSTIEMGAWYQFDLYVNPAVGEGGAYNWASSTLTMHISGPGLKDAEGNTVSQIIDTATGYNASPAL